MTHQPLDFLSETSVHVQHFIHYRYLPMEEELWMVYHVQYTMLHITA